MSSCPPLPAVVFLVSALLSLPLFSPTSLPRAPLPSGRTQPLAPLPSLPATIPAFPEQSDAAVCPLNLSVDLFPRVESACGGAGSLRSSRCCPVLAAWLYAAYSATALKRTVPVPLPLPLPVPVPVSSPVAPTAAYEMPLLPDDTEVCQGGLERALDRRKLKLVKVNETCDLAYCYCGVRLHPLSCPAAFTTAGGESVRLLERECHHGCNRCLRSLLQLGSERRNQSRNKPGMVKEGGRVGEMHRRDCHLMGITWLLAKNRTAYFQTASLVLRALRNSAPEPSSCSFHAHDDKPLPVDSSQLPTQSAATMLCHHHWRFLCFLWLLLVSLF